MEEGKSCESLIASKTICVVVALLLSAALHVEAFDAPNVISTQVFAAQVTLFDTFPIIPSGTAECFDDGGGYQASPLPSESIPVPLFYTEFFRIKEYDDNSTTMDRLSTLAGVMAAFNVFDYFGLGPKELWALLPVTRNFGVYYGSEAWRAA